MVAFSLILLLLWHRQTAHSNCLQVHSVVDQTKSTKYVLIRVQNKWHTIEKRKLNGEKRTLTWTIRNFDSKWDVVESRNVLIFEKLNLILFSQKQRQRRNICSNTQWILRIICNKRDILFLFSNNVTATRCQVQRVTELNVLDCLRLIHAHVIDHLWKVLVFRAPKIRLANCCCAFRFLKLRFFNLYFYWNIFFKVCPQIAVI